MHLKLSWNSQEISCFLKNLKTHYHVHYSTQLDMIHRLIDASHPIRNPLNVTFQSTTRASKWFLSLRFQSKILYAFPISPLDATCPNYLPLFDVMWFIKIIMKFWVHNFPNTFFVYVLFTGLDILLLKYRSTVIKLSHCRYYTAQKHKLCFVYIVCMICIK
jgi:hypothetical protein